MNLNRLIEVLTFVQNHINDMQLILHYKNLKSHLLKLETNSEDNTIIDINNEKKYIIDFHEKFSSKTWGESQNDVIERLNKEKILGTPAIKRINNIFTKNKTNPQEAAKQIDTIITTLNSVLKEISILLKSLEPIIEDSTNEKKETFEDNNILIISFESGSFFQNIHYLEKFCRIWNRILLSFMYLTNEPVEFANIHDLNSNNISFILNNKIIDTITQASYQVLKGYKKVVEIRRLQLEIESINLSNKSEIKNLLDDEVINIVDIISSQVTYELLAKYKWDKKSEKDELYKNIQISLKQIVNFIEKGGKIESKNSKELNSLTDKIIVILKSIKELEKNNNYKKSSYQYDFTFEDEDNDVERFE